jgi:hypothetical protein
MHILRLLLPLFVVVSCGDSKSSKPEATTEAPIKAVVIDAASKVQPELEATLTNTSGTVEVRRDGSWLPAAQGEALAYDDSIRTAGGATAGLKLGDISVVLEQRSEVTVREMSDEVKNLRLDKGILAAKVQGGGKEKLRVRAAGSSAVAEAAEGSFTVFNDGKGLVAVAPSSGTVQLTSSGGDQLLAAGERGVVTDDKAPKVDKVPQTVLLNVNWPEDDLARPRDVVVTGKVEATTRVEINGVSVPVSRDGSFEAPVSVKRGKNPVSIVARDLSGTTRTSNNSIAVSQKAPKAHADTKNLWKDK